MGSLCFDNCGVVEYDLTWHSESCREILNPFYNLFFVNLKSPEKLKLKCGWGVGAWKFGLVSKHKGLISISRAHVKVSPVMACTGNATSGGISRTS